MAGRFVHVERAATARGDDPLVDLRVVRTPGMAAGLATLAVAMIGYGGFLFSFALHLQGGLGESALRAGLTFAPAAAAFGAAGYWWRRLPGRIHHGITPAGFALAAVGYLLLAAVLHGGSRGGIWLELVLVALGGGLGFGFGPLLSQALVYVPAAKAADASGLLTTTIQLAQVVGVAVFGSLFLSLATHHVGHASAIAVSTVDASLTALTVAGLGGALLLARTVRRAAVAQPRRRATMRVAVRAGAGRRRSRQRWRSPGRRRRSSPASRARSGRSGSGNPQLRRAEVVGLTSDDGAGPGERDAIGADPENRDHGRIDPRDPAAQGTRTGDQRGRLDLVGAGRRLRHEVGDADTALLQMGEVGRGVAGRGVDTSVGDSGAMESRIEPVPPAGEVTLGRRGPQPGVDADEEQPHLGTHADPAASGHGRTPAPPA